MASRQLAVSAVEITSSSPLLEMLPILKLVVLDLLIASSFVEQPLRICSVTHLVEL